jgi:hypothetical protein
MLAGLVWINAKGAGSAVALLHPLFNAMVAALSYLVAGGW